MITCHPRIELRIVIKKSACCPFWFRLKIAVAHFSIMFDMHLLFLPFWPTYWLAYLTGYQFHYQSSKTASRWFSLPIDLRSRWYSTGRSSGRERVDTRSHKAAKLLVNPIRPMKRSGRFECLNHAFWAPFSYQHPESLNWISSKIMGIFAVNNSDLLLR